MSVGKNRSKIGSVVVQEGMETAVILESLPSEPVIYLMGCDLIGGFLRTNTERGAQDNLNAKGMVFKKLCMSDIDSVLGDRKSPSTQHQDKYHPDRQLEVVYGCIARLSALATGREIKELGQNC